jgi:hypothetical protein
MPTTPAMITKMTQMRAKTMNPDTWLSFFEVLSIGAGVLAVAALIGTVVMGKKANARQAERVLTLETGLADAKTKQAEAERRLLEVQNRIAWRHSFDEKKFREVLDRGVKGTAEIVYLKDDSEANIFAESLWFALAASGWSVDQPRPGKDSPDSRMPFFLREAGVLVTNVPQLAVAVSGKANCTTTGLMVGLRLA